MAESDASMTTDASQQKEPMAIREPKPVQPAFSAMEKFFFLKPLRRVYARVQGEEPGILERLLREMNITVDVAPEDLDRVPRTGAALVVWPSLVDRPASAVAHRGCGVRLCGTLVVGAQARSRTCADG